MTTLNFTGGPELAQLEMSTPAPSSGGVDYDELGRYDPNS